MKKEKFMKALLDFFKDIDEEELNEPMELDDEIKERIKALRARAEKNIKNESE